MRGWQSQRGTHCRRHRKKAERSVPLLEVEVDSLILAEEESAREAQNREEMKEWEEYENAWDVNHYSRGEKEEMEFMRRARREVEVGKRSLERTEGLLATDPVVAYWEREALISEANIVETLQQRWKSEDIKEENMREVEAYQRERDAWMTSETEPTQPREDERKEEWDYGISMCNTEPADGV